MLKIAWEHFPLVPTPKADIKYFLAPQVQIFIDIAVGTCVNLLKSNELNLEFGVEQSVVES